MRLPLWLRLLNPLALYQRAATTVEMVLQRDELAVLVIDAQREFADPRGERGHGPTDQVSKRLRSIIPAFRKQGLKIYPVYFAQEKKKLPDIDFFRFKPLYADKLIVKNTDSAFRSGNADSILHKDKKKSLLVCGFNLNACVMDTVVDARRAGYNVIVMEDLTANDLENGGQLLREDCVKAMKGADIHFEKSQDVLKMLKAVQFGS